ncbi:MAG: hypothetical protein ICV73_18955 [Acetobacteraceae bacterium]|nr:hypothetical protein [Acetobacteraceae bacterium]
MHRTDYDFDVISGPSTPSPIPSAAVLPPPASATPRPSGPPAPAPQGPAGQAAERGEKAA